MLGTVNSFIKISRGFHSSSVHNAIIKLTRLRVVDNSEIGKAAMAEGKPPKCIHVYNKKGIGTVGDKIMVAIKGEKKKAIIVGCKRNDPSVPRFDSNNIVLIDDTEFSKRFANAQAAGIFGGLRKTVRIEKHTTWY